MGSNISTASKLKTGLAETLEGIIPFLSVQALKIMQYVVKKRTCIKMQSHCRLLDAGLKKSPTPWR